MKICIALLAALLLPFGVQAQSKFGQPPQAPVAGQVAPAQLPERKDVVSWRLLAQVELVKVKDRFQPQFSAGVTALDAKAFSIPGSGAIESLNLASAVNVCAYEMRR